MKETKDLLKSCGQTSNKSQKNEQNNAHEVRGMDSASMSVSSNARKITPKEIQLVQNMIERCLQLYMNKNEVVDTLWELARFKPDITTLVWQALEAENAEFFKAYNTQLALKSQIILFNKLLEQQCRLMMSRTSSKVPLVPIQSGIQQMPGKLSFSANNLPTGHSILLQPSIPPTGHPQPGVNDINQMQINSGLQIPRDPVPVSIVTRSGMALTPVPVNTQDSLAPTYISHSSVDAIDTTYASDTTISDCTQIGPNVEDHGQTEVNFDASLDSTELDVLVRGFLVDHSPSLDTQTQDSS